MDRYKNSFELNNRLHQMVPGGSHTYSKGEDQFPWLGPKIMRNAKGAYCWDVDDNKYIDWAMGNRVMILGHANETVDNAVIQAIKGGTNFSRPGILEYEMAEFLLDLLPNFEMVKFGKNGSDCTTAAIRLSRAYTGRKLVAVCEDHPFFSTHDWFIGSTAINSGVPSEVSELTVKFKYNDLDSVKDLYERYPGQIAAVILEPVKNEPPKENFLQKLRQITKQHNSVLIFDEMISGMRFDVRGAHHIYGVYPDIATFGKAVANGYSFSFIAGTKDVMELGGLHHNKQRVFLLSQTHSSESTGLAAGMATIKECMRLNTTAHVWELGGKLKRQFAELAKSEKVENLVRIIGFDCNPQILVTDYEGVYSPGLSMVFHQELISRGILIPWISVTQSHTEDDLRQTLEACQYGMIRVREAVDSVDITSFFAGDIPKPVFRPFNQCLQSNCGKLNQDSQQLDCCRV